MARTLAEANGHCNLVVELTGDSRVIPEDSMTYAPAFLKAIKTRVSADVLRSWVHYRQTHRVTESAEHFKAFLFRHYAPLDAKAHYREALRNLRQGKTDSVAHYYQAVMRLLSCQWEEAHVWMDADDHVDEFVRGLRPALRDKVLMQRPNTMEVALELAKRAEFLETQGAGHVHAMRTETKERNLLCFRCGGPGHFARDCQLEKAPRPPQRRSKAGRRKQGGDGQAGDWRDGPLPESEDSLPEPAAKRRKVEEQKNEPSRPGQPQPAASTAYWWQNK